VVIVLALASSGLETWALVDVDGVEHALAGTDYAITVGVEGRFMPPVALQMDDVPFRAGKRLRRANVNERPVPFPLVVFGDPALQVRQRVQQLAGWTDPTRGDIAMRCTAPDGTRRELVGRYSSGLDRIDDPSNGLSAAVGELEITAVEPYWQDLADTVETWTVPAAAAGFFPFSLPLRLPSSTVWVSEAIDNSGYDRQDAWPVWTIVGPGVDPVLRNLTTGKAIRITRTLATGDRLIIDTRPGVKSVTDGLGSNVPTVAGSTLWALRRGLNAIQVELSGATSGVSSVSMSYRRKFLGP
jgi:hypothetical protein